MCISVVRNKNRILILHIFPGDLLFFLLKIHISNKMGAVHFQILFHIERYPPTKHFYISWWVKNISRSFTRWNFSGRDVIFTRLNKNLIGDISLHDFVIYNLMRKLIHVRGVHLVLWNINLFNVFKIFLNRISLKVFHKIINKIRLLKESRKTSNYLRVRQNDSCSLSTNKASKQVQDTSIVREQMDVSVSAQQCPLGHRRSARTIPTIIIIELISIFKIFYFTFVIVKNKFRYCNEWSAFKSIIFTIFLMDRHMKVVIPSQLDTRSLTKFGQNDGQKIGY